jgi:nitrile hydratase accessory protein
LTVDDVVSGMFGNAALPRQNGELVFQAPWESRAFGVAVALHQQRFYSWDEFRSALVTAIAAAEPDDGDRYYEHWLNALENVLIDRGILDAGEFAKRAGELAELDEHHH